MVYGMKTGGRRGGRILPGSRAIVLHQGGQCRWAGGIKGWLIRAHEPRSKRISWKGQVKGQPDRRPTRATRRGTVGVRGAGII